MNVAGEMAAFVPDFEVARVRAFESGLLTLLRTKHADLLGSIGKSGDLSKDDEAKLKDVIEGYAKSFT